MYGKGNAIIQSNRIDGLSHWMNVARDLHSECCVENSFMHNQCGKLLRKP